MKNDQFRIGPNWVALLGTLLGALVAGLAVGCAPVTTVTRSEWRGPPLNETARIDVEAPKYGFPRPSLKVRALSLCGLSESDPAAAAIIEAAESITTAQLSAGPLQHVGTIHVRRRKGATKLQAEEAVDAAREAARPIGAQLLELWKTVHTHGAEMEWSQPQDIDTVADLESVTYTAYAVDCPATPRSAAQ
jgi:hypothetical protein